MRPDPDSPDEPDHPVVELGVPTPDPGLLDQDKQGERLAWAVIGLTVVCFLVLAPAPTLPGAVRFIAVMGLLMVLARDLRAKHDAVNNAFRFSLAAAIFVLLRWWLVLRLYP